MSKVSVSAFSVSLDGFGAGPNQSPKNPLGLNGMDLHDWAFKTRTFRTMFGQDGGETSVDDEFARRSFENVGAWIIGRNMFGPVRGAWPDETWKGWWGENPPYHGRRLCLPIIRALPFPWRVARRFISSLMESKPLCDRRWTWLKAKTSGSAVVSRQFSSTCALASSMRCTLRSRPFSSVRVKICLQVLICARSDTHA